MRFISPVALRTFLLGALGLPNQACSGHSTYDAKGQPEESNGTGGSTGGADGTGGAVDPGTGGTVDPGTGGRATHDAQVPLLGACTNPVPALEGVDTGFFRCAEGYEHRAEARQCPSRLPRDGVVPLPAPPADAGATTGVDGGADSGAPKDECLQDSDCPTNAFCIVTSNAPSGPCSWWPGPTQPPQYWRVCQSGCRVDADCGSSQICVCGTDIGACVQVSEIAGCRSDADCGDGLCVWNAKDSTFASTTFACQLPGDQCNNDGDCTYPQFCSMSAVGRRCSPGAVCGRPFLVDHSQRLAPAIRSGAWLDSASHEGLDVPLDPALAKRLAEHWTEIGLMEHASVAAFARFTLQLLALGAPAELVRESTAAQADEMRHATIAFEFASAYGGAPVGPGRLDLTGAMDPQSREDILRTTIHEGCVGETRAALEAAEAARLSTVPSIRKALEGIAADEGRHAALAWRVVSWLLAQHPELAPVARDEFRRALRAPAAPGSRDAAGLAHGMLDSRTLAEVQRAASDDVISPCADALLHRVASAISHLAFVEMPRYGTSPPP